MANDCTTTPRSCCIRAVTVRQDCTDPTIPSLDCNETVTIVAQDNPDHPFVISTDLYDESCNIITDENDNPIIVDVT